MSAPAPKPFPEEFHRMEIALRGEAAQRLTPQTPGTPIRFLAALPESHGGTAKLNRKLKKAFRAALGQEFSAEVAARDPGAPAWRQLLRAQARRIAPGVSLMMLEDHSNAAEGFLASQRGAHAGQGYNAKTPSLFGHLECKDGTQSDARLAIGLRALARACESLDGFGAITFIAREWNQENAFFQSLETRARVAREARELRAALPPEPRDADPSHKKPRL